MVRAAEGVKARVLMEQAGQEEGAQVGVVGLVQESAPGIGVEAGGAFSQGGVFVHAFCAERGQAEEDEAGVVEGLMGGDVEAIAPPERVWGDPDRKSTRLNSS